MKMENLSEIETPRLRLVLMSAGLLRLLVAGDDEAATKVAGYGLPDDLPFPKDWGARGLRIIEEDPGQHPWVIHRAIVRKRDNRMVGYIRFHEAPPSPHLREYSDSGAELGYAIAPSCRRNGYAKEAVVAMMNWANHVAGVRDFFLSIGPANAASLGLSESMGFRKVGEKIDPIDGLEWIMKADIEEVRSSPSAIPGNVIRLRTVTADDWRAVCALWVREDQRHFVADNAFSLAQAAYEPGCAPFSIYRGEELVGFAMTRERPDEVAIMRLMFDRQHQGKGYGRQAIVQLCNRFPDTPIGISCVPENTVAARLYESVGFVPTGEIIHGEMIMRRKPGLTSEPKTKK